MKNTIRDSYGCPLNFLRQREQNASQISWGPSSAYKTFLTNRLDVARNLYRKDLFAHFGCVNAIEFSNEGCWLISGEYIVSFKFEHKGFKYIIILFKHFKTNVNVSGKVCCIHER